MGCSDPDPATTPIAPQPEYVWRVACIPNLTAEMLTEHFKHKGFEVTHSRAVDRMSWRCTQKRGPDATAGVSIGGFAPDQINEVDASFLNFGADDRGAEIERHFVEVTQHAYRGRLRAEAIKWLRANMQEKLKSGYFEGLEISIGHGGNLYHLRIRRDPRRVPGWMQ